MRRKIDSTNDQQLIKTLSDNLIDLIISEKQAIIDFYVQKINEVVISGSNQYDDQALRKLFTALYKTRNSIEDKTLTKNTWESNISPKDKVDFIAQSYAVDAEIPSIIFIEEMTKFIDIIKNDVNLISFLNDPQQYIYTQPNLTAYQQQILKQVVMHEQFNNLLSTNKASIGNTVLETPITYYTQQLDFSSYGSADAIRFPQCINPEVREDVLAKSKKNYSGPSAAGMGVLPSYNRKAIEQTANGMKKMKQGACHNFAQLAADHLLTLMDEGKISQQHIKMVSHNNGINSHTFLLLGHESDDLTDLSNCLIIDGWAVAMGHQPTSGVFTTETYPFPDMTSNLSLCYDNQAPNLSESSRVSGRQSLNSELGQRPSQGGFFSGASEPLSKKQQAVVNFLKGLINLTENSIKKGLFQDLIDSLKEGKMQLKEVIEVAKKATLAFYARSIELDDDGNYLWKGLGIADDSALSLFNNPVIVSLWVSYAKKIALVEEPVSNITNTLLHQIVRHLSDEKDYASYSQPKKERPIC